MKSRGDEFEAKAVAMLCDQGIEVVARNYTVKAGEIDIIALEDSQLIFVEVRSRSNKRFESAAGSVDRRKQRRIIKSAQRFLQDHPQLATLPCRFDVIAFEPPQSTGATQLHWIKGAFTA